mgnify:CR=1 FL=1
MVVTEEIIAAYVDGNVSEEERKEVLRYLAIHPEMQDLVLALMDESSDEGTDLPIAKTTPLHVEQSYSDIAFATAAFAPRMSIEPQVSKESIETKIDQRLKRMSVFWDEVQRED